MLFRSDTFEVEGIGHNLPFVAAVMDHPRFVSGNITTAFIAEEYPEGFKGATLPEAELRRLAAAAALMQNIQSTPNLPNNYLIMGDFNDDPEDRSITEGLNAGDVYHPIVNLAYVARSKDSTIGTLAWHDGWNMFDQIMVSRALYFANLHNHELVVAPNAESQVGPHINIYKKPWMLQHGGKYDGWPLRTFAGKKYMNGFSDHLPVYTDLVLVHRH